MQVQLEGAPPWGSVAAPDSTSTSPSRARDRVCCRARQTGPPQAPSRVRLSVRGNWRAQTWHMGPRGGGGWAAQGGGCALRDVPSVYPGAAPGGVEQGEAQGRSRALGQQLGVRERTAEQQRQPGHILEQRRTLGQRNLRRGGSLGSGFRVRAAQEPAPAQGGCAGRTAGAGATRQRQCQGDSLRGGPPPCLPPKGRRGMGRGRGTWRRF